VWVICSHQEEEGGNKVWGRAIEAAGNNVMQRLCWDRDGSGGVKKQKLWGRLEKQFSQTEI